MRMLSKSSHYSRQFGMVQRFGWQKEYRRNFGGEGGSSQAWPYVGDNERRREQRFEEEQKLKSRIDEEMSNTNIDITSLQRIILGFGSALISILDPKRGDMIATMGETTFPHSLLKHIRDRMERDITGAELLKKRPRINNQTIDLEWLASLPDGTVGKEYTKFLKRLNTSPDARPNVQFVDDDPQLIYVMQRYRETHDFTHVLLQMRPNMLGEVTVKYFEAIQLGFPMCVSAAIFGAIRLGPIHRQQLLDYNIPWVIEQAEKGRFLLALDWEQRFEQSILDLRPNVRYAHSHLTIKLTIKILDII